MDFGRLDAGSAVKMCFSTVSPRTAFRPAIGSIWISPLFFATQNGLAKILRTNPLTVEARRPHQEFISKLHDVSFGD
jgi:hypothetical protein